MLTVGFGAVLVAAFLASACGASNSSKAAPGTASSTEASTTAPAACNRPHAAGQFPETFTFQGVARTYQLYVPAAYSGRRDVPVVFDFHGFGSNAVQQMVYGNFKPLADRDDFLIVAPDGQGTTGRHFNLTGEPGLQNDVTMVLSLLDHIEATFCVDADRVFATGMSDGGAMTSVLACEAPNRFAAFGAVAVVVYRSGCGGSHPVALMAFSGTADPIVPFNGGKVNCCGGSTVGSAPGAMAGWAAHDKCGTHPTEVRLGTQVRRRTWTGCEGSGSVVFYIIDGGGHTWPGSIPIPRLGLTTKQIDASATIWKFFAAHPLTN